MGSMREHIEQLDFFRLVMSEGLQVLAHGFGVAAGIEDKVRLHCIEEFGECLANATAGGGEEKEIQGFCLGLTIIKSGFSAWVKAKFAASRD